MAVGPALQDVKQLDMDLRHMPLAEQVAGKAAISGPLQSCYTPMAGGNHMVPTGGGKRSLWAGYASPSPIKVCSCPNPQLPVRHTRYRYW